VRRALRLIFALALLGNVAVAGWLAHMLRYGSGEGEDLVKKGALVQIREALFTETTRDLADFAMPPAELRAHGFLTDAPEAIRAFRETVLPGLPYGAPERLAALPEEPIARARAIALLYSVNGNRGICGGFADLRDALVRLPDGYGCCSDHGEAFLALGPALGLEVRELYHGEHAFNELWVPALGKWVWIDTQFATMARAPGGDFLGGFEIRERLRTGEPIEWDFFGTPVHWLATRDPAEFVYYKDIEAFANLRVIWGSNILAQDAFERRTAFLPRAARHVLGHWLGVFPHRLLYEDEKADEPARVRIRKAVVYGLAIFLPLGTLVPPLVWIRGRR